MSGTVTQTDAKCIQESIGLGSIEIIRHPQSIHHELIYEVRKKNDVLDELHRIIEDAQPGRCIIYCGTPDKCIKLHADLSKCNTLSGLGMHHGKLEERERDAMLRKWHDGKCHVMIATSSFGMGIHAPDVRCVVHYVFPLSMSKYSTPSD
jgi:superfamily II DNA helicase RecQ